jgi:hypothetical protein
VLFEIITPPIRLEQFVGGTSSISPRVFRLLADVTGITLVNISNLAISDAVQLDIMVFTLFMRITHADFRDLPSIISGSDIIVERSGVDRYPSTAYVLKSLIIRYRLIPVLVQRFPLLTSAKLPLHPLSTPIILEACGPRLLRLELSSI